MNCLIWYGIFAIVFMFMGGVMRESLPFANTKPNLVCLVFGLLWPIFIIVGFLSALAIGFTTRLYSLLI